MFFFFCFFADISRLTKKKSRIGGKCTMGCGKFSEEERYMHNPAILMRVSVASDNKLSIC